jgi:putative multiple sugar transport system ATP-binding protein
MVGRSLTDRFPKRESHVGDVCFEVKNWCVDHPVFDGIKVCDNVNFNLRKGEVLGISGLMGAGRTELAMSLFGKSYGSNISGQAFIKGQEVKLKNEQDAIAHGLAYVTEDRKTNGLVLSDSIAWNTTMAKMDKVSTRGIIDFIKEKMVAQDYVEAMKTKTPSVEQAVGNLSGGNQQKVLLSKWMFAEPDVLILDEPTRGIDVGAKYEIYCIMNDMVAQGKAVVMISSELPELLGMCDRIYVMNEGEIVGEFTANEATQEKIMSAILSHGTSDNKEE